MLLHLMLCIFLFNVLLSGTKVQVEPSATKLLSCGVNALLSPEAGTSSAFKSTFKTFLLDLGDGREKQGSKIIPGAT